jgi:hypothetical protein
VEHTERSTKRLTIESGYDKLFIEGYNSFMEGEPMSYNIYNGNEYDKWLNGYMHGYEELRGMND